MFKTDFTPMTVTVTKYLYNIISMKTHCTYLPYGQIFLIQSKNINSIKNMNIVSQTELMPDRHNL